MIIRYALTGDRHWKGKPRRSAAPCASTSGRTLAGCWYFCPVLSVEDRVGAVMTAPLEEVLVDEQAVSSWTSRR